LKAFFPNISVLSRVSEAGRKCFAELLKLSQSFNESFVFKFPLTFEKLSGLDFEAINLTKADFEGAILDGTNFRRAYLWAAYLVSSNLRGANLENSCLELADFVVADLEEASLQRANLRGANLKGANLKNTNVLYADFRRPNGFLTSLMSTKFNVSNLKQAKNWKLATYDEEKEKDLGLK